MQALQRAGSLDSRTRVRHGKSRERQIADALRDQAGLPVESATEREDKDRKIDRWLNYGDRRVALQIKYRESGRDLLFEVFDLFLGWDHEANRVGRDTVGDASEYAVLLPDAETVVVVPTAVAKAVIADLVAEAREHGFTYESRTGANLVTRRGGARLELKVQPDPANGRPKMVAYIPAAYFAAEAQARLYRVNLPKEWR